MPDILVSPEPPPPSSHATRLILITSTLLIVILGITAYLLIPTMQAPQNPALTAQTTPTEKPASGTSFATYKEEPSIVIPAIPSYTITAPEISNLKDIATATKQSFSSAQVSALTTRGFFTQPTTPTVRNPEETIDNRGGRVDDMIDVYTTVGGSSISMDRKPENAVFITSDFLLHIYHVLIDRTVQHIEQEKLFPAVKELTAGLFADTLQRYRTETDPQWKQAYQRLAVFYLVPLAMVNTGAPPSPSYFDSPQAAQAEETALSSDQQADSVEQLLGHLDPYQLQTPPEIMDLARQELALVANANQVATSPVYGNQEDYTQYTPRGHYTKNSLMRTYFRAMMWYGRHGFSVKNEDQIRDALLMTHQLRSVSIGNKTAAQLWETIYQPTVFFVGRSDDLSWHEYDQAATASYGADIMATLHDADRFTRFQTAVQQLPGPKILSSILIIDPEHPPSKEELLKETKGFRFMGQRFIPDSYLFSSLTQGDEAPDPETGQKLPSTPTALMVMSILGSDTADTLLNDWIATNAPQSDNVIAKVKGKLKTEFASFDTATWTQNIYWSWLYNLLPLFQHYGVGYPQFMQTEDWQKKSLVTALGSWTELRHDTLLYAKQSYAEMGGGPPEGTIPPVPKGYVEPNIKVITRLQALVQMTTEGLDTHGLLVDGQKEKFTRFGEALTFFRTIAEKELANTPITDEEYEQLRTTVGLQFPSIVWALDGDTMTERDARMGVIADVHTDALKGQILYEAVGAPAVIYVAVKDSGGTRLTRGAVYSYYEFTKPLEKRLRDEDWQAQIYEGNHDQPLPAPPQWTNDSATR